MCRGLSKKEAIEFLGLDEKIFENFFRNAGEFEALPRDSGRGRFYFDEHTLSEWRDSYRWRSFMLTPDDYFLCLDFALAMHYRGYVSSDWSTGRQRESGQKLANWIRGQLGEIAVKKFFQEKFQKEIKLDFGLHGGIVPQDIIGVKENGAMREPNVKVAIKASKPKSAYLVLKSEEVNRAERQSDVYIFTRPGLPDDHLLRIAKNAIQDKVSNQPHYSTYRESLADLSDINCEVAGYCNRNELEEATSIPGQKFEGDPRYVKKSGELYKAQEDWERLISTL